MSRNQTINLFVVERPSPRLWLPPPVNKSLTLPAKPQPEVRGLPLLLKVTR